MLRIVRFAKAAAEFVADGCASVSREQYEERLRICEDCPHLRGYHCSLCGCLVQLKAIGRAFDCPDQPSRWPLVH